MAHYPDPTHADDEAAHRLLRRLTAWTPPTPRWAEAPARARIEAIARERQARRAATLTLFERLRRRADLIGWLVEQPAGRPFSYNSDPNDPRAVMYDQISSLTTRYNSPQASLFRYTLARA